MPDYAVPFEITQRAHRVIFGRTLNDVLRTEIAQRALEPFILISTNGMARRFEALATRDVQALRRGTFSDAVTHVPEGVARSAADVARSCRAQHIVAFGGGSALDTAKAVSHWLRLPVIAIPTNFSGSEVTWNFGLTRNGVKRTVLDPDVLPKTVIYDPALLATLSARDAACSGMNAIAHAVEGLYASNANPLTSATALAGIRTLVSGLVARNGDPRADGQCLVGAWLCGEVLSQVGMGLHHRICHVLGGTYGLPHAAAHTVMLPYSIDFNYDFAPALSALSTIFAGGSVAAGVRGFVKNLGAPTTLRELGFRDSDIAGAAKLALAMPLVNPRPVATADVQEILTRAFAGQPLN